MTFDSQDKIESLTQEQIDNRHAFSVRHQSACMALANALRRVLNSPEHQGLTNTTKAEILLYLENGGEYDPHR